MERRERKGEGRSVEEMNRKDDRSEGYHAHGFHRWAPEHETRRRKKQHARSASNTNHSCISHQYAQRAQLWLSLSHTHIHTVEIHSYTTLCILLLTQSLHILITIHTMATKATHSSVHSLSLRVMTHLFNQTHTTTRTIIKQTSTQSLSIAYLCTTSLVKSN